MAICKFYLASCAVVQLYQIAWKKRDFYDWNLDDPPAIDPGDLSEYRRVRPYWLASRPRIAAVSASKFTLKKIFEDHAVNGGIHLRRIELR